MQENGVLRKARLRRTGLSLLIGYKMFLSATSGRPRSVTDFCFSDDKSLAANPVSSDSNSINYIKHMRDIDETKRI